MHRFFIHLGFWLILGLSLTPGMARAAAPQTPGHHKFGVEFMTQEGVVHRPYLVSLSNIYTPQKKWPLLVFLHGLGERGEDLQGIFVHGPAKMMKVNPQFQQEMPLVVLSPQVPGFRDWAHPESIQFVLAAIDQVCRDYPIDTDRIYLTGLSMGGLGTWRVALADPGRFAALVPICARAADPANAGQRLKNVITRIIVGGADGQFTEDCHIMFESLRRAGAPVELIEVPNAGHGVWEQYYADPKFYTWLLEQRRSGPRPRVALGPTRPPTTRPAAATQPDEAALRARIADRMLKDAQREQARGRNVEAYRAYRKIVRLFGDTPAAGPARQAVARLDADAAFVAIFRKTEVEEAAREILVLGHNYKNAESFDLARENYLRVLDNFPDTQAAPEAKKALATLPKLGK